MALAGAINVLLSLEHSKFTTGTNKAVGGLKKFKAEADGLNGTFRALSTTLGAFGVGIGAVSTINFLQSSVAAFNESDKSARKLAGVLEASGGVYGHTAESMERMVDSLEKFTAIDDAVIRGGASVLATFQSLSADGFDRALKSSLDLAAALDTDVKSAAMQLGKALTDPINGLAALGRAGIKFTEEEQALIQSLVETNNLLKAQDLILDKLESKVAGVAASQATKIDKLATAWDNLKESVGGFLSDAFLVKTNEELAAQAAATGRLAQGNRGFNNPFEKPFNVPIRRPALPRVSATTPAPILTLPTDPRWTNVPGAGRGDYAADMMEANLRKSIDDRLARDMNSGGGGFAGFGGGAERGSAEAFQRINAFKFGNAGGDREKKQAAERDEKRNVILQNIADGLKQNQALEEVMLPP